MKRRRCSRFAEKFPTFRIVPNFLRTTFQEQIFRLEIREESIKFLGLVLGNGNGKIMVLTIHPLYAVRFLIRFSILQQPILFLLSNLFFYRHYWKNAFSHKKQIMHNKMKSIFFSFLSSFHYFVFTSVFQLASMKSDKQQVWLKRSFFSSDVRCCKTKFLGAWQFF